MYRESFDLMFDTVGKTPLVKVYASLDEVSIYAKLESLNPGVSVKDRIGKYMFEQVLESDELPEGGTIIEPTTGNTGIGFAVVTGQLGIRVVLVVPERFNVEKQMLMRVPGADVVNTPIGDGVGGAIDRAHKFTDEPDDAAVPRQLSSPLDPGAYYETTASEAYDAFDSEVGTFVAGCSIADTLMGMTCYDRERNEDTFATAVEPEGSFYARLHGRDAAGAPYKTEGTGTHDPATNELFDPELVDGLVQITDHDTHDEVQHLATKEGHPVVSSAAANSLTTIDVVEYAAASDLDLPCDVVATILPGSSERYLPKGVYGDFKSWEGQNRPTRS